MTAIKVGDMVAYAREFLISISQLTGPIPFARGTVTALEPFGEGTLASIDWRDDNIPPRVLVDNLILADERYLERN